MPLDAADEASGLRLIGAVAEVDAAAEARGVHFLANPLAPVDAAALHVAIRERPMSSRIVTSKNYRVRVAGIDEAGRGPLAGPVVAAAVILDPNKPIRGLADSKQLTPEERDILAPRIRERAIAWAVGWADRDEIDCINILQATFLAMRRALLGLAVCPTHIQVDGNRLPRVEDLNLGCSVEAIIGGDDSHAPISAASILAKTTRDALMVHLDSRYPGFEFSVHKGYGTPMHLAALERHKPCPLHRRSFQPVADLLDSMEFLHQLGGVPVT